MKIFAAIALFVLLGVGVNGQTPPAPPELPAQPLPAIAPRALVEMSAIAEKTIKGAPFSAEEVNESVQTLADGNRIVRNSTNRLYRNSEGRFRRELSGGSGGALGGFYSFGPGITILDPVGGYRYMLDSKMMTARVDMLRLTTAYKAAAAAHPASAERAATVLADKLKAERELAAVTAVAPAAAAVKNAQQAEESARAYSGVLAGGLTGTYSFTPGARSKYETRTEELGTQNIEGVNAVGTRTVTTIPAGDIGNERPIEIVYEKWYSDELQMVVMSKHSDPRYGEQTYRLTNIVRSEPDPSLFELPQGYKIISDAGGSYTIRTTKGLGSGQTVVWSKSSGTGSGTGSGIGTTVKATKP